MTPMRTSTSLLVATILLGCLGEETGIDNRHVQGLVTLPPSPLWEKELNPRSAIPEDNNDGVGTADGPYAIKWGYHILRGVSDHPCDEISVDALDVLCPLTADEDVFRVRTAYQGALVISARIDEGSEGDVDIVVEDKNGVQLFSDPNTPEQSVDELGEPLFDDAGNAIQEIPNPRWSTSALPTSEFVVHVTVNSREEEAAYELVFVGDDPRRHDQSVGIEEDAASFETGTTEAIMKEAFEIMVGAYLSDDVANPGTPVGGTSCESWTLDELSETFTCAWDMVFVQGVRTEQGALIPEMADDKDNDCDGIADAGLSTVDGDGDGGSPFQGDCDDTDPEIGLYRGDTNGDRKDNDCDGWADNGPDDEDNDGDGFCENGVNLNPSVDNFCRGVQEASGVLCGGDCNDGDARVLPGLGREIPQNGVDDDCSGGDSTVDRATNTDGDGIGLTRPWGDLEEIACGTDPFDAEEEPEDANDDGLCDSDCLGTVGCAQDIDGDGFHSWVETLNGSDLNDADSVPLDSDGDGTYDGDDNDADGDGWNRVVGNDGDDCMDLDASTHPHLTDEDGATNWNYDVVDGIDNDCDGEIDENRDWERDGADFSENTDYQLADEDGDGYSMGNRDCNDTDPTVHLGAWELESTAVVSNDFSVVYLFAGDVTNLNQISEQPSGRRVTSMVAHDLQKARPAWDMVEDWDQGLPPTLRVVGLPLLEAAHSPQPIVGQIWTEEKDDAGLEVYTGAEINGFSVPYPPFDPSVYQELRDASEAKKTNELYGSISDIVADTWDGDNDVYHVTFPEAGFIDAQLNWDTPGGDYDAQAICWYYSAANAPAYYQIPFSPTIAGFAKPEVGRTIVPLPDGADCYFFVMGYSGVPGTYTLSLTPQGN